MKAGNLIARLPKAELHLHLEGSVDPPTLSELSRRHNTPLPTENNRYDVDGSGELLSEKDVQQLYSYHDFMGFMMAFKAVTERLRTPEDYELVTYRMMERLRAQNILHAEVYSSAGVCPTRKTNFDASFARTGCGRQRGGRGLAGAVPRRVGLRA